MSIPEVARAVAALKVMSDLVKNQQGTEKGALMAQLNGLGVNGTVNATLADGTPLGTVGMVKGRTTATIDNDAALTAWVEDNHPGEIETVRRVRPGYVKKLLDAAKVKGAAVDAHGEVIPGILVGEGDPYLSVRLADDAEQAVVSALESGFQPLALPAGDGDG